MEEKIRMYFHLPPSTLNTASHYPVPELYKEMKALESTIADPMKRKEFRTGVLAKLGRKSERMSYSDTLDMISGNAVEEVWAIVDQILDGSDGAESNAA